VYPSFRNIMEDDRLSLVNNTSETGGISDDGIEYHDILDNDSDDFLEYHEHHEYHDYSEDDAATKMHHLMHSDTIIVVFSLVVMIMVGLVFRSLCMKLTSINQRKERVRGGLKQIAESMDYVTRSMSNDLYIADSPRSVIRTYSNYNRRGTDEQTSPSPVRRGEENTNNMRVVAINNNLTKKEKEDMEMRMFSVSIHCASRVER